MNADADARGIETGVEINTGLVARGQWICCPGQWNLLSTGPVGLYNFETQLLRLHGLLLI